MSEKSEREVVELEVSENVSAWNEGQKPATERPPDRWALFALFAWVVVTATKITDPNSYRLEPCYCVLHSKWLRLRGWDYLFMRNFIYDRI